MSSLCSQHLDGLEKYAGLPTQKIGNNVYAIKRVGNPLSAVVRSFMEFFCLVAKSHLPDGAMPEQSVRVPNCCFSKCALRSLSAAPTGSG